MPTTLSTFATSEFRMRHKEEFLTDGLNAKLAVNTPPGTYRGFRLTTHGSASTVTIQADTTALDHVAVCQTSGGRSLSVRKTGGDFSISLAAFVNKTVVIALYGVSVLGTPTSAEIRGYELAPVDTFSGAPELSELVVLGTVVVPAAGTIPAANITYDRRTPAWSAEASEAIAWAPIIKNPSFEHGVTAGTNRHSVTDWVNRNDLAVNGAWRLGTSNVRSGAKCLEFNKTNVAASTARIEQLQELPVVPGQVVRVIGWVRQLIAPTGGSYQLNLYWGDLDSGTVTSTTVTASAAGTDASYRKVEATVTVPATKFVLKTVAIEVAAVTTGSTGVALVVDDVQVYVEAGSPLALAATANRRLQQEIVTSMVVEDPNTYTINQLAGLLRFDRTTPASEGKLVIDRKDMDAAQLPPALELFGRILGLGSRVVSSAVNARLPRITSVYSGTHPVTLLWTSPRDSGSGPSLRYYMSAAGELSVTINAQFDGTNWIKDVNGTAASMLTMRAATIDLHTQVAGTNTWAAWTKTAVFSGPNTPTVGTPATYAATLKAFDIDGNVRAVIDHLGLPAGRFTEIRENWLSLVDNGGANISDQITTGVAYTSENRWVVSIGGTGIGNVGGQNVSTVIPGLSLRSFVAANNDSVGFSSPYLFNALEAGANNEVTHMVEWEVDSTDLVGTPALDYVLGLGHDIGLFTADNIYVRKTSASANWFFHVRDNSAITSVDTAVAAAIGRTRFRIDYLRTSAGGDGPCARLFINGILRARIDTNMPNQDQIQIASSFKSTGATSKALTTSPVVYRAIRVLSDDDI